MELDHYTAVGYDAAVTDLTSGSPLMGGTPSQAEAAAPLQVPLRNIMGRVAPRGLLDIQSEWLTRMITTTTPLVERMTLFLHDHFATAFRPGDSIDTPELAAQNDTFRRHALGNWKTLCHEMLEDVALSAWLDNNVNMKEHPNENLARELMELFTLGPGNYTERDVREAARALTGYRIGYSLAPTGPRNVLVFEAARHDDKLKRILGATGNFMPHNVIDIVLAQPAAPRFLSQKLIQTFVTPAPSSDFVDRVAHSLIVSGWELAPALQTIFTSPEFKVASSFGALVKSPAEFIAGSLRALDRSEGGIVREAVRWMNDAGQALYDPPNVTGWTHNEGWLGAGHLLARYNAGNALADHHVNAFRLPGSIPVTAGTAEGWGEVFGITDLATPTSSALRSYLARSTTAAPDSVAAAMITLVVASPDFLVA